LNDDKEQQRELEALAADPKIANCFNDEICLSACFAQSVSLRQPASQPPTIMCIFLVFQQQQHGMTFSFDNAPSLGSPCLIKQKGGDVYTLKDRPEPTLSSLDSSSSSIVPGCCVSSFGVTDGRTDRQRVRLRPSLALLSPSVVGEDQKLVD
jgi:hypothetical protein